MVDRRQFLQAGALAAGMAALPGVQARTQGGARVVSTWDFGVPANQAAWKVLAQGGSAPSEPASMKVLSRWMEEMPMIAIASFTFSTEALTWLSHSGWSGWPSRRRRETKVS